MRPVTLLIGSAVLAAVSLLPDRPWSILLALAALAAAIGAYRTRTEWPMSPATRAARAELVAARAELAAVSDRDREETDAYLAANDAVIAAERPLKWWQRLDVELS